MLKRLIADCVAYADGWTRFLAAAEKAHYTLSEQDKRAFTAARKALMASSRPGPAGLQRRSRWKDIPMTA